MGKVHVEHFYHLKMFYQKVFLYRVERRPLGKKGRKDLGSMEGEKRQQTNKQTIKSFQNYLIFKRGTDCL